MLRLLRIAAWPLVVKVPVLVAGLMVTVAITISYVVLWRFIQDQESNLGAGGQCLSRRSLRRRAAGHNSGGRVGGVRRTGPRAQPVCRGRTASSLLSRCRMAGCWRRPIRSVSRSRALCRTSCAGGLRRMMVSSSTPLPATLGWRGRLRTGGVPVGRLFAELDIADLLRLRREILLTLILVNACLTLAFALGGYFVLKRMLQPLGVLTRITWSRFGTAAWSPFPRATAAGSPASSASCSIASTRWRALSASARPSRTHLAEQEKYAMLGRLASGMAHEVNNPLGGMLNAIDTIQAHGNDPAVLQTSLDFLKRGLAGIRNVARAALVTYKGGSDTNILTRSDLDDLPFLVQHETGARWLRLDWQNRISEPLAINGPAVRQITLNLLLNACAASPPGGLVTVTASCSDGTLRIAVADEGPGLPEDMAALLDQAAPASGAFAGEQGSRTMDDGPADPPPRRPCRCRVSGCRHASGRDPSGRVEGGTRCRRMRGN